jgi:hypothetical protein
VGGAVRLRDLRPRDGGDAEPEGDGAGERERQEDGVVVAAGERAADGRRDPERDRGRGDAEPDREQPPAQGRRLSGFRHGVIVR